MQAITQDLPLFPRLLHRQRHSQKHLDPTFVIHHDDAILQAIRPNDFALALLPHGADLQAWNDPPTLEFQLKADAFLPKEPLPNYLEFVHRHGLRRSPMDFSPHASLALSYQIRQAHSLHQNGFYDYVTYGNGNQPLLPAITNSQWHVLIL